MRISDWSSDVCSSDLRQGETPQILMDWLVAGIWTGLRPAEWRSTDLEMREDQPAPFGRRAWLYVINAKATNGRGNGMMRTLDLTNFSDPVLGSIGRTSQRGSRWFAEIGRAPCGERECKEV